ncbi:lipoate-protein ligase B (chromatophore) [Paulinella micropora]|uniref:Probable octanoyltransferase n=1 Tax=Paulinella micropora TaxID=1928728 RepID=A0A1L5YCN8_9EUKA|nr:lipoate-protein ligase B [Paulinella micropora]AQX45234.1 lipoate-protein ligase B [Paulinella micropora]BBL86453.1 lipoate-protein ligase B [Paulinella micropora]
MFLNKKHEVILFKFEQPIPYLQAWRWQNEWQEHLITNQDAPEAIWFLQHPPCYTVGRNSNLNLLHFNVSIPPEPLYRINRGGEVTYHGYGQLMIYLVINLQRHRIDLHLYIRTLEQTIIDTLACLNVTAHRVHGLTGVWIQNQKVAAIGVGIRRWITQHGIALNIKCNLSSFQSITPCGLMIQSVGELDEWIPTVNLTEIQNLLQYQLTRNLCFNFRHPTLDETFRK